MSSDNHTIGKFTLVNCIASGQATQIWEVVDSETTRRVAMKLLLPEKLADPESISGLKNEFKAASSFDHPNIPKYLEIVANKKLAYFTMELFNAPNLKTQLYNDIRGVHIRLKRLVELVSMALEHIHERGWVHRDIKPDNILMNKSSEVRVIDFSLACRAASGLSKMLHRKQATVKGTRTYMAPEQILGKPLTPQTDIYNFGVTLFELLTGQTPFKGSTPKDLLLRHLGEAPPAPSEFNPNVTPEMDLIVQRMLAKKPDQRQKKIAEFMAEFRNVPLFKEEVTEKVELTEKEKAEQELKQVLGERLDSRTDALRSKFGVAAPAPAKKKKPPAVTPAAAAGSQGPGQGARPGAVPPPGQLPPPMMPMPGMYPGQMPMAPYPMMPMPQGPVPWVAQMPPGPAPGGMPAGPWMQPPQVMPGQPYPQQPFAAVPGAVPTPPVAAAPVAPPKPPVPIPPPTAMAAVPVSPPVRALQPTPDRPAGTTPPQPVAKKTRPAAPPPKPGEGFKIEDLAGFDELPPVS
ncbi:MAG: serine/threonine-protein kinase [Deltaproteobacteria bacterium]